MAQFLHEWLTMITSSIDAFIMAKGGPRPRPDGFAQTQMAAPKGMNSCRMRFDFCVSLPKRK